LSTKANASRVMTASLPIIFSLSSIYHHTIRLTLFWKGTARLNNPERKTSTRPLDDLEVPALRRRWNLLRHWGEALKTRVVTKRREATDRQRHVDCGVLSALAPTDFAKLFAVTRCRPADRYQCFEQIWRIRRRSTLMT
jgi:hypothetical protein